MLGIHIKLHGWRNPDVSNGHILNSYYKVNAKLVTHFHISSNWNISLWYPWLLMFKWVCIELTWWSMGQNQYILSINIYIEMFSVVSTPVYSRHNVLTYIACISTYFHHVICSAVMHTCEHVCSSLDMAARAPTFTADRWDIRCWTGTSDLTCHFCEGATICQ